MKANNNESQLVATLPAFNRQMTAEQIAIVRSAGDIRINAVAGSGKTTTIIEYAAARPSHSGILYLAFNKSVKLEAAKRFAEKGLHHVKVETAHSLAYRYIVPGSNYRIRPQSYKTSEIADLLGLSHEGEKHGEYIIANHINKFITYFCNSDQSKVQDLDYLDIVVDEKARIFVKSFYTFIETGTRQLLAKMDRGEIEIIHDFYLKKFQLSNPRLPYDYILFDEGQDASAAMLDVFLKQKATRIIVGDTHQQIYGWRHAVNSLERADFQQLNLSASFRFRQDIADLAAEVIYWKKQFSSIRPVVISGRGNSSETRSIVTLARTNLGLLLNAIEFVTDHKKLKHIYFEGNIQSYTYADEGASLYDVLNLSNNEKERIRDKLIQSMANLEELEEYIEKTEDVQLGMMVEIVKEYGDEIPGIIRKLKDLQTSDEERGKAEMIFSTVHKAKGLEYDVVYLVGDFINPARLARLKKEKESGQPLDINKWKEEINLLYVAITRTRNRLHIPESLLPDGFAGSAHIRIIKEGKAEEKKLPTGFPDPSLIEGKAVLKKGTKKNGKEKAYDVGQQRQVHKDAYQPWTPQLDRELKEKFDEGLPVSELGAYFGRTRGSIIARLKKLDYFDE